MRVDTFRRPNVERAEGAQALPRQVAVDGRGCQDHRHRDLLAVGQVIAQHDMPRTGGHSLFRLLPDPFQARAQRKFAGDKGTVDLDEVGVEVLDDLVPLRVAHEGRVHHQDFGLARILVEHVLEIAEPRLQAHHPVLAQAVDGRVRHLAKVLPEVVAQRAVARGQHRRRRIIPHRRERLLAGLRHRRQDLLQLLNAVTRRDLPLAQLRALKHRRLGHTGQRLVHLNDLLDPVPKPLRRRQLVLDLGVVKQLPLGHIHRQKLPRPQRALLNHLRLVQRDHARLGPGNHHTIVGHHIAHRPQPVPIQPRTDPTPIRHRQGRRPIPRLHHRIAIGIHIAPSLRQLHRLLGPAFRHQHGLGHRRIPTRPHQHLENRIQCRRI